MAEAFETADRLAIVRAYGSYRGAHEGVYGVGRWEKKEGREAVLYGGYGNLEARHSMLSSAQRRSNLA